MCFNCFKITFHIVFFLSLFSIINHFSKVEFIPKAFYSPPFENNATCRFKIFYINAIRSVLLQNAGLALDYISFLMRRSFFDQKAML